MSEVACYLNIGVSETCLLCSSRSGGSWGSLSPPRCADYLDI